MYYSKPYFFLFALVLIAFAGCKSSTSVQDPPHGSLEGRIIVTSGADTIHSSSTVFIPSLGRSVLSDTFGRWTMPDIPFGYYDLYATANGYDTLIFFNVLVSGGTSYAGIGFLGPTPTDRVQILSVNWSSDPKQWQLLVKGLKPPTPNDVVVLLDTVPNLAAKDYHVAVVSVIGTAGDTAWTAACQTKTLDTMRFHQGQTLYLTAVAYNGNCTVRYGGYPNDQSYGGISDPHHGNQFRLFAPGPLSEPYITKYPW